MVGLSGVGRSSGMLHKQVWFGSSCLITLVNKRLELTSVFQSTLESYVRVIVLEFDFFEVLSDL